MVRSGSRSREQGDRKKPAHSCTPEIPRRGSQKVGGEEGTGGHPTDIMGGKTLRLNPGATWQKERGHHGRWPTLGRKRVRLAKAHWEGLNEPMRDCMNERMNGNVNE